MYVYIYMYIYTYIHLHMYLHKYISHSYIAIYTYVYIHRCIHIGSQFEQQMAREERILNLIAPTREERIQQPQRKTWAALGRGQMGSAQC